MPKFGTSSKTRLEQCDSRLQDIFNEVIEYYDCTILCGHRTEEEQNKAYTEGNSKLKFPQSKHNSYPSLAVDAAPWPIPGNWGEKWKDRVKFYELKAIVFFIAEKHGVTLRFGGDWDKDGDYKDNTFDDLVHFEIVE